MSDEKNFELQDILEEFSGRQPDPAQQEPDPETEKRPAGAELFEWLQMVMLCVLGAVVAFNLVVRLSVVDGQSMDPTLEHGELMLVWSLGYSPKQGDVVILNKTTADFLDEQAIVKRVIALEGQTVDIDYGAGVVFVDGEALEEDYIYTPTYLSEGMEFPLVIDEGCVFLMGDNRGDSRDSRAPEIGQVDTREVLGQAVFLMLPGTGRGEYTVERDFGRIGGLN